MWSNLTIVKKYREFRAASRNSFGFRIFISFTLAILLIFLILTPVLIYNENKAAKSELMKDGRMLSSVLADNIKTWVYAENKDMLEETVKGFINQEDVREVAIFTKDNRLLLTDSKAADVKKNTREASDMDREVVERIVRTGSPEAVEERDTITFLSPVFLKSFGTVDDVIFDTGKKEEVSGYVKVVLDKKILRQAIKSLIIRNTIMALLFLASGIVIIAVIFRRVTRPLNNLSESVRLLGLGESVRLPVESSDEIGKLAESFNTMSDNLKKRDEEKSVLEERLRLAQKMEAVGTLARGIAHDFNNILATVRGSVYILDKKLGDKSPLRKHTEQMLSSISKAKDLVQGLLLFSKTQKLQLAAVEINDLVSKLEKVISDIAGESVEVKISLNGDAPVVMADPLQVEQVLINLCRNARDAMPDGGVLSIGTTTVTLGRGAGPLDEFKNPGRYAVISVADTGMGLDEVAKERMFEPFFTTKDVGKGSGLGLSIVFGIVENHGGHIRVDSKPGEGTIFSIYLPLLEKSGAEG